MERETPILNMIKEYIANNSLRFHMPGHKGDAGYFGGELLRGDITELDISDNLLHPKGVIQTLQELHAKRTGAGLSLVSVNGSSAGVLAMILSAVQEGDKILMARDIHISAANALVLSGAEPVFIDTETDPLTGLPGAVSADAVKEAMMHNPDAKAVYITYPNYFGLCADLEAVCEAAHDALLPVLVDGAHAAHFAYSPLFPASCAECSADIWSESLHKTLPAMNQTAMLNIGHNSLINPEKVKFYLNMFTTTSPSYILLASADYASAYMEEKGNYELYRVVSLLENCIEKINAIKGLNCIGMEMLGRANIVDKDVLKLVIDVSGRNISGFVAKKALEEMGIFIETADIKHILLISTVADQPSAFETLTLGLSNLPEGIHFKYAFSPYELPELEFRMTPKQAVQEKSCHIPLNMAAGFVSSRTAGVYPPGVPCLLPGQLINRDVVDYIEKALSYGFDVFGLEDGMLRVLDH